MEGLCVPALIYLIFGTYKGLYNMAFMQIFITILFTYLLNVLCRGGLGIISWLIVAIPFLLMSVIAVILLGVFGLNPATGKAVYTPQIGQTQSQCGTGQSILTATQPVKPTPTQATPPNPPIPSS